MPGSVPRHARLRPGISFLEQAAVELVGQVLEFVVGGGAVQGLLAFLLELGLELGTTVLVSSHNLNSINDICRRIILLDKGKVYLDKEHVPGSQDAELEDYFFHAAQ